MTRLEHAAEFARLAEQLHAEPQEQQTLGRIVSLALQTVESADSCSVTVSRGKGKLTVAAATDEIAGRIAALHQDVGEGPYLDVASTFGMVSVDDLAHDARWPLLSRAAADLDARSLLSIRLDLSDPTITASLNLLADRPYVFDTNDLAIASIFARHAASALDAARQGDSLRAAARSRQIIGFAEGMLMQRFGLTLDQAFELLRRYSQTHNVKLRVLAERLVESGPIPAVGDVADSLQRAFGIDDNTSQRS
jgi:GAF domain-containing protein